MNGLDTPGGVFVVDSLFFLTYHSFARLLPNGEERPVPTEWQLEKYTCIVGLQPGVASAATGPRKLASAEMGVCPSG